MSNGPQIFHIDPKSRESRKLVEVDFTDVGLTERRDIQEWVCRNPEILGEDLLIVGKEFSGFEEIRERLDLLAVDREGTLVVIELKRDDTGEDVHWQAIKYASFFSGASVDRIVDILVQNSGISKEEAETRLLTHLDAQDLDALNNDQRIILASHRFARQVTSAVLWLNDKVPRETLVTCIQLTPYLDVTTGSFYLLSSVLVPAPGIDVVRIGTKQQGSTGRNPNIDDDITLFVRGIRQLASDGLPAEIRPDMWSPWAGAGSDFRYYGVHYSREPWDRRAGRGTFYEVVLYPPQSESGSWTAHVIFKHDPRSGEVTFDFRDIVRRISLSEEWRVDNSLNRILRELRHDALDDSFRERIAEVLRELIEKVTPVVDALADTGQVDQP